MSSATTCSPQNSPRPLACSHLLSVVFREALYAVDQFSRNLVTPPPMLAMLSNPQTGPILICTRPTAIHEWYESREKLLSRLMSVLVIGSTISPPSPILAPEDGDSVSLSCLIRTAYRSYHDQGEDRSITPAIVSAIGLYSQHGTVAPRYRRTQSNTRPILLHRTNCDRAARRIYRRARALDSALHEACCMYVMAGALTLHCRKNSVKSCRLFRSSAQTIWYVPITTFVVDVYLLTGSSARM